MARGTSIPVPAGMTVNINRSIDEATLSLLVSGAVRTVRLPRVIAYIRQVCPLSGEQAIIFGDVYQATNISILDLQTGRLLDSFDGVHPTISPDQRWIAFEEFYPAHTELPVSSRYRIYDLMKAPAKNRAPGISTEEPVNVGTVVFPIVVTSGDSEQQHDARIESFAWAPDSKTLAFIDEAAGKLSVILVTTDSENMQTYVAPLPKQICVEDGERPREQFIWDATKLDVSRAPDRSVTVTANGVKDCSSKPITLFFSDFRHVESESAKPRKNSVLVTK